MDDVQGDVFGVALLLGALGLPLVIALHRAHLAELRTGEFPAWGAVLMATVGVGAGATIYFDAAPYFLKLFTTMFVAVFVGAGLVFFAVQGAPKVLSSIYWAIRYFVWRATGMWGRD